MFLVLAVEENQDWATNKLTASRQRRRYSNQQSATQAHAGHPNPSSATQAHTEHSKPGVLKLLLLMAVFLVARNCGMLGTCISNIGGELETCACERSVLRILYLLLTRHIEVKFPLNTSYKLSFICNHIMYKILFTLAFHSISLRPLFYPNKINTRSCQTF